MKTRTSRTGGRCAYWLLLSACGFFAVPMFSANGATNLIVPTAAATVDGGALAGSSLLRSVIRLQEVHGASQFPAQPITISELRFRPSAVYGSAFSTVISNLQINISTTVKAPHGLSSTFAANVGSDDTIVYNGPAAISSAFTGPANGPKEFDIVIPLTTPFVYDRSAGNLLIDYRNFSGSTATYLDSGATALGGRAFALNGSATTATAVDGGVETVQIAYTLNTNTPLAADFNVVRDFSLNGNPNGMWSYGWQSNPAGLFTPVTHALSTTQGAGVAEQIWELGAGTAPYFLHFPLSNTGTGISDGGFGQFPPGTLIVIAGGGSPQNLATVRFTAPSNGNYQVGVAVRSYLDGGPAGDTDFHVARNGAELFGQFLPGVASAVYTNTLSLATGDTIDLAVGRGADNNNYGSGLKIAAVITPTTNAPTVVTNSPPETPALISLWRGENNAQDSVGDNDGALINGVGFAPGVNGQAFQLNGASFIRVPDSASLRLTNELSFTLWFQREDGLAGSAYTLFDKRTFSQFQYGANHTVDQLYFYYQPAGAGLQAVTVPRPSGGVWHHFAGTYQQLNGGVRLMAYVDGTLMASNVTAGTLAAAVNTTPLAIGSARDGAGDYFKGLIDEVALYNYALSPAQVFSNYSGVTLPPPPPPPTNAAPALVSLWRGETNAQDSVGSNDGVLVNGVGFAPGISGQAFQLDGASFIRVPDSASLHLTHELTIEMWFKRDAAGAGALIDKRNLTTCNYGAIMAPEWGFQLYYDDPSVHEGNQFEISFSPFPAAQAWRHFAGTYRQLISNRVELLTYMDGQLVQSNVLSGNLAATLNNAPLVIGSARDGAANFFKGLIDEVALYNYALSPAQVFSNYSSLTPPPPTNATPAVVSRWRGEGNANDSVGSNDGVLVNGVGFAPGISGQAFQLDGASFIRVPDSASLHLTHELTIEMWFKRDAAGAGALIDKRNLTTCNYGAIMAPEWGFQLYYDDPSVHEGNQFEISFSPFPAAQAWRHFAGTYRQLISNRVELLTYMDGQLVQSNVLSGNLAATLNSAPLAIGSARDGAANFFKGLIDEVALYNYALSPGQVFSNYNSIVTPPVVAGDFNVVRDFSLNSNPHGVWSYGWQANTSGLFTPVTRTRTTAEGAGVALQIWELNTGTAPYFLHFPLSNTGTETSDGGAGQFPPGTLIAQAGAGAPQNLATIRFTAPSNGNYQVNVAARSYLDGGPAGDTDFHVARNGVELFGRFLPSVGSTGYTNTIGLAAGDTIDFATGRGADNNYYGSGLKIAAVITPTTNAPTVTNAPPPVVAADFNVVRDFSLNGNPNGVWSYGWQSNPAGHFTPVTHALSTTQGAGVAEQIWELGAGTAPYFLHFPLSNTGTGISDGGLGQFPPGTLIVIAGGGSPHNLATVRFTAPSNGNYQVGVAVRSYLDGGPAGDTDFHVARNGTELFGQFLPGVASAVYTNTLSLATGDTIDLAVGRGADNNNYGSGLKIAAVITPTTNAPTVTNPPPPVVAGDFNVVRDFSLNSNPHGVWSYGWQANTSGLFTPVTRTRTTAEGAGVALQIWELNTGTAPYFLHFPLSNTGTETSDGGAGQFPPGTLIAQAGAGAPQNLATIRFTAPSNGNYQVNVAARSYLDGGPAGDTDFHVARNGVELFGRFLPSVGSTGYTNTIGLAAGDTIDFATGRGADNNYYGSGLKIAAVITPTTNAPTVTNPPPPVVVYDDFNAGRDFSAGANPGAVWSYGWKNTVGGAFSPLTWLITPDCDNGVPVTAWLLSSYGQPAVYCNTSSNVGIVNQGQSILPPGTIWIHPGINGRPENYSAIRFTAPSNGNYHVGVAVAPLSTGNLAGDTDFHVVRNGAEMFGRFLGTRDSASFSNIVALNVSDTLDFVGGRGADGNEYGSSLRVTVIIAPTTNAPTVMTNVPPPPMTNGPVIVTQPAPFQSVDVGDTVTFSVNVSGTPPLSFQWLFNGVPIPGATSAILVLSNVQPSSSGSYRVIVSNSGGSASSSASTLNVSQGEIGGTIIFGNNPTNGVYDVGGSDFVPAGGSIVAALFAGPSSTVLQQIGGVVSFVSPGRFVGGTRSISGMSAGQTASVQVKVWDSAYGSTYEQAIAGGSKYGASPIFTSVLGGGIQFPGSLAAMPSFVLILPTAAAPQIAGQPVSQSVILDQSAAINVSATGGGLTYQWFHDGAAKPGATLPALNFAHAQKSDAGDYFVVVSNSGGSVTSQVATLSVNVPRTLAVVSPPDSTEGALVSVPLVLESDGSVGGLTFALHYNADLLSSPEVVWDASLSNGLQQANVPVLGHVRGVFALNGTVVPAGTQTLAVVNFRARTVLTNSTSELLLDIVDVADVSGGLLAFGNDVRHGSATVIAGAGLIGDNNGNGRLDIGDVSLLLRLLAQLDSTRPWDLAQNDLNTNSLIDSGDAIRILLAAAAIESPAGLSRAKVDGVPDVNLELGLLSPTVARGSNGLVTYQVRLQNGRGLVSGAAFTLNYPTAALRIADPQSQGVGAMVPLGSAVAWNVSPTNNYAQQNGHVRFVVSSAAAWASRAGVLAQITFQVQPGATNQYAWPLTLSSMEITSLGYNRPLLPGGALFASRDPQPALLGGITRRTNGILQFNIAGDAQATLAIDASVDLVHWITLTNIINAAGTVPFNDPDAAGLPRRFYRVRAFAP